MDSTPILNGAPVFIILGFTVALAAYLRQVSLNAQDVIERIKSNAIRSFPYDERNIIEEHTSERLKLLGKVHDSLSKVTRPLFILMLVISIRIILYSASRVVASDSGNSLRFLHWFDVVISFSILGLICGLWLMHDRARKDDSRIRKLTSVWEESRRAQREAETA